MREYTRKAIADYSNRKKPELERPYGDIAERLNEWKKESGVFNKDLSKTSGVPEVTIGRVYQGTRFPDHRLLKHLHEHYGIDLNWLICGKE